MNTLYIVFSCIVLNAFFYLYMYQKHKLQNLFDENVTGNPIEPAILKIKPNGQESLPNKWVSITFPIISQLWVTCMVSINKSTCWVALDHSKIWSVVSVRYICRIKQTNIHHVIAEELEGSHNRNGVHLSVIGVMIAPTSIRQNQCLMKCYFLTLSKYIMYRPPN